MRIHEQSFYTSLAHRDAIFKSTSCLSCIYFHGYRPSNDPPSNEERPRNRMLLDIPGHCKTLHVERSLDVAPLVRDTSEAQHEDIIPYRSSLPRTSCPSFAIARICSPLLVPVWQEHRIIRIPGIKPLATSTSYSAWSEIRASHERMHSWYSDTFEYGSERKGFCCVRLLFGIKSS